MQMVIIILTYTGLRHSGDQPMLASLGQVGDSWGVGDVLAGSDRAAGKQNWFSFKVMDAIVFATSWTVECKACRFCAIFTCVA